MYFYVIKLLKDESGMKTKDEYMVDFRRFKEQFASKYGIRSIGIFESVARGEHRLDSLENKL